MDKHYLTPLFPLTPWRFLQVGRTTKPISRRMPKRCMRRCGPALHRAPGVCRPPTTGTLADLAQTRADLAIIARLRPMAAALEVAGRMACRAALIVSSGIGPDLALQLKKIAHREGMHLLGPNSLGLQRPALQLNASAAGPLARTGSLALVSQSGRSLRPSWTGQATTRWVFPRWCRWARIPISILHRCWISWPMTRRPTASWCTWRVSPAPAHS